MGTITKNDLNKVGAEPVRAVFEANDRAARSSFTGKVILEVVAGKTQSLTTVREAEYPEKI